MNITCSICSDLFAPSSEIYVTNCGHAFHESCLKKWLERSKTCPQCRTKTYEKNIVRVYFNIATSDGSQEDVVALQNKLDALKLQLHLNEKQMKRDEDTIQSITKRKSDLEAKYNKIKDDLGKTQSALISAKEKLKYQESHMKYLANLESEIKLRDSEIKSLKDKLEINKKTEEAVKGTVDKAIDIINDSACSKTLASIASALKKELQLVEKKKNNYFSLMKRAENQLDSYKKELKDICMERDNLKTDLNAHKQCQQEMQNLKKKIEELMQHSKVLDPTLVRVATESPAPASSRIRSPLNISPTVDERVKQIKDSDSPYLQVKSNAMGLLFHSQESRNKLTSNKKSIFKTLSSSSIDEITTIKKPLPEYNYDGFGGHSKEETFPTPRPTQGIKRTKSSMSSNKFRKLSKPTNKKIDEFLDLNSLD